MPRPTPSLELDLLGAPRVERGGQPIEVDTRKATALLAYLAVAVESQSRDSLAALFWPDADQAHAHAALRRTLSALNKALGGTGLNIDRESVGLERGPQVRVDVDQFHARLAECLTHGHPASNVCPACLPPLAEAATLYRGDFLSGFTLRDSPGFDDWQFFQAESLRRELASALERLLRGHASGRDYEVAIEYARRWLALDPLHEPAQRHLMQLYAQSGQHAAALRQYGECVRVLKDELGVPPLDETTRLYEAIKERRGKEATTLSAASPVPHPPSPVSPGLSVLPLVGREAEWSALLHAYDSLHTDGQFVVLEGEAGIGKTRLAEAFLQHVRSAGAAALTARCYEGEMNLAFGPFVEALRAGLAQSESAARWEQLPVHVLGEASRLLPELAALHQELPPIPPLEGPGAQTRFFESISQLTLALCGGPSPGLLFLDDLHWADEASLDLLTYLVRRLSRAPANVGAHDLRRTRPLCLLVTWRGAQLPANHRLRALLAEAQRGGLGILLPLSRLSLASVSELVRSGLSPSASGQPPGLIQRLYDETEGLPFFLVEYLTTMRRGAEAGNAASAEWPLPDGVRGLLQSRLGTVGETGRQLLSAAAVIGRSFDFDILREASGRTDEEAVTALEELTARGLVSEVEGGDSAGTLSYDFSHEKLRTLVYAETSLARRRLLHRRVAQALVARHRRGGREVRASSAGLIAQHYQLAGQAAEAARHFKLAGDHARTLYANTEALAHFHAALALGHPDMAALHEAIGDLQTLSGDYGAALNSYEVAAALCPPESRVGLEHKLGNVYHRRGEWEVAESHFQAALDTMGEEWPGGERARLFADWSLTAYHRGQMDQALKFARGALELAEAVGDRHALAQAHNILGVLASSRDDPAKSRHHLEQSLSLAEALNDPGARVAALNNLALALSRNGEPDQALKLTERALTLCASLGDRHREAALHNNLADLLHKVGQSEAAMAHLKQAVALFAEIGVDPNAEVGRWQPEIWKLTEW